MKKLLLAILLTLGSLMTLPAFAWPEVDHMNMCGPATKVVRAYKGNSQGFAARDRYIAKRGNAYYFRTNCPNTTAPVKATAKKANVAYKAKKTKRVIRKTTKVSKGANARKISKRLRGGYDKHADCVRVDRMNSYGRPVRVVRQR
jgi:hypothetical protein